MLFNSLVFLYLFLPITYVVFWQLRTQRQRYVWLTTTGYVFYSFWNYKFCALLAFSTIVSYLGGLGLRRWTDPARRKTCLVLSVCSDLAVLAFFKYADFGLSSFAMASRWAGFELLLCPAVVRLGAQHQLGPEPLDGRRRRPDTPGEHLPASLLLHDPMIPGGLQTAGQGGVPGREELPSLRRGEDPAVGGPYGVRSRPGAESLVVHSSSARPVPPPAAANALVTSSSRRPGTRTPLSSARRPARPGRR